MGGGGGGSGPTLQQQQLETEQALTNANLNLEENSQRKAILNSMMGTRVFNGSALSRALRGNTPGSGGAPGAGPASATQTNDEAAPISASAVSLLDQREKASSTGATPAGGAGASGGGAAIGGGRGAVSNGAALINAKGGRV